MKFDIDASRTLTVTAHEQGTQNMRKCIINSDWISKLNFLKEAELKKTYVIIQENSVKHFKVGFNKK